MISSSHSVIHRLTPPTCTLEIWGKQSPLSKWANQEIVKDVRFKLSFDDPALAEEAKVTISGDSVKLEAIYEAVINYVENYLQQSFPVESFPNHNLVKDSHNSSIYLKPQGSFFHQLFIPDLEKSPIDLSTVQLFDLVSALEEYKNKVAALPGSVEGKSPKVIPLWFKGVAGLALVVGLTTVTTKIVQQQATESESIASVEEPKINSNRARFDDVEPPEISSTETKIEVEPKITEPLSSAEKLPSPPAVDTPKPPPNIPDPAKYPIPEGNLVIPPPNSNPIVTNPKIAEKSQSNADSSQVESRVNISSETEKAETNLTISENSNEASNNVEINLEDGKEPDKIVTEPNSTSEESLADSSLLARKDKLDSDISQSSQLQEVKAYFKQNWQPPQELKQTIEYRLIIAANGSIIRIIPIGKASEIFIDRTKIPLMGEKFVSPLKNTSQATVRLILSPDGTVATFLE